MSFIISLVGNAKRVFFVLNLSAAIYKKIHFTNDWCVCTARQLPAHFSINAGKHLNEAYPDQLIGSGSLYLWPARSPDLACLESYLWSRLKDTQDSRGNSSPAVLFTRENEQRIEHDEHLRHWPIIFIASLLTPCSQNVPGPSSVKQYMWRCYRFKLRKF